MSDAHRHANHRGNAPMLSPEAERDLEHLWCHTCVPGPEISARLSAKYGQHIRAETHADRRGYERHALASKQPHAVVARLQLASVERWNRGGRPADNTVRKPDGRFAVAKGGFSMMGGKL